MPTWFFPPPPFTGGRQPHSPKDLGARVEDSTPAGILTPPKAQLRAIVQGWQPPDPQPFLWGSQPLDNRKWRSYPTDQPQPIGVALVNLSIVVNAPREAWLAQTGERFAHLITPDQPAPGPTGLALNQIVALWPREGWPAQRGATLLPLIPPDAPLPLQASRTMAALFATAPREDWRAQRGATIVALIPPDLAPTIEIFAENLAEILAQWPRESWPAQRGATLLPLIPPDAPLPLQASRTMAAEFATAPREDWRAQRGATIVALIPPDVAPTIEIFAENLAEILARWPQDSWPAQAGAKLLPLVPPDSPPGAPDRRLNAILAWQEIGWRPPVPSVIASLIPLVVATGQVPYVSPALLATLIASWPREDWKAQRGSVLLPLIPPDAPLPRRMGLAQLNSVISMWPAEAWPAQRGSTILPLVPTDAPPGIGKAGRDLAALIASWPREAWDAQRGSRLLPLIPPDRPIPSRLLRDLTTIIAAWPVDAWSAQRSPLLPQPDLSWLVSQFPRLGPILQAWQVEPNRPPTLRQIAGVLTTVRVDFPPPTSRALLLALLSAWNVGDALPSFANAKLMPFAVPPLIPTGDFTIWTKNYHYVAPAAAAQPLVALVRKYVASVSAAPPLVALKRLRYVVQGDPMPAAVKDFPAIDAVIGKQTLTFDFGTFLPQGVSLTGTPTVTISTTLGTDATPAARLIGSPSIGTAPTSQGGSGIANAAILQQVGGCLNGVTYLLVASCSRSDGSDIAVMFAHLPCAAPS